MRDLQKFTAIEWLKLLPLKYALRQMRNDVWLALCKKNLPKRLYLLLREMELHKGLQFFKNLALSLDRRVSWLSLLEQGQPQESLHGRSAG